MDEKKAFRQKLKQRITEIPPEIHKDFSTQIHLRLFELSYWKRAQTIAVTVSMNGEMDTRGIIEQAWQEGKTVVVPKCHPKDKRLQFRKLTSYNQLESVYYGLLEPDEERTEPIKKEDIDVIIVPGLAFDLDGYRIGFGGGYYDRFLSDVKVTKLAQALDDQVFESLPHESHDIPVDIVLTPEKTVLCSKSFLS